MNWKRERKQERRVLRGLRRDIYGRVKPPSHGKRYMALTDEHLHGFERLVDLIDEETSRIQVIQKREEFWRLHSDVSDLAILKSYFRDGLLWKSGFPDAYLLEIDDDDDLEFRIRLMF